MNARHLAATALAVVLLSGRVLDRTTGQGLAHVRVASANAHAVTDAVGRYALTLVRPGSATIVLESDDVPAQHFNVIVGTGTTHRDFRACSTTLDYDCGAPAAPNGASGAG